MANPNNAVKSKSPATPAPIDNSNSSRSDISSELEEERDHTGYKQCPICGKYFQKVPRHMVQVHRSSHVESYYATTATGQRKVRKDKKSPRPTIYRNCLKCGSFVELKKHLLDIHELKGTYTNQIRHHFDLQ